MSKKEVVADEALVNESYGKALKEIMAREYIDDIKDGLIHDNRFFSDSTFMQVLKKAFDKSRTVFEPESTFYRARIYNKTDKPSRKLGIFEESAFEGYDEKESFVNKTSEWPIYGRMHPSGIRVLYTASDEKTAAKELNPSVDELVSIATIKNSEPLIIADLSRIILSKKDESIDGYRIKYIIELLSQGYSEMDYVISQYVAGYCANQGFDGIGYRSKYSRKEDRKTNKGINYTIFKYDKCRVVSSKLHLVKQTSLRIEPIDPLPPMEVLKSELKDRE